VRRGWLGRHCSGDGRRTTSTVARTAAPGKRDRASHDERADDTAANTVIAPAAPNVELACAAASGALRDSVPPERPTTAQAANPAAAKTKRHGRTPHGRLTKDGHNMITLAIRTFATTGLDTSTGYDLFLPLRQVYRPRRDIDLIRSGW
jgi:hypothetical protein